MKTVLLKEGNDGTKIENHWINSTHVFSDETLSLDECAT